MTPLDKWAQFFRPEETYLPLDPDELDEICCDSEERVIAHTGIEILNCFFNNDEVQEIRRQLPSLKDPYVKVKFHRDSLSCIWVADPRTGHRVRVPNSDPVAAELSAYEMSEIVKLQSDRQRTHGETLVFAEALRRMKEIGQSLLRASTQRQRRKGFRMLGMKVDEELTPLEPPPKRKSRRQSAPAAAGKAKAKNVRAPLPLVERVEAHVVPAAAEPAPRALDSTPKSLLTVPIFAVTKRPADRFFVGGVNADPR